MKKKKLQYIFNAIKSSSNFGKQQVANGEREMVKKKKIKCQLVTVNWKTKML